MDSYNVIALDCLKVFGYTRLAIYDLSRNTYFLCAPFDSIGDIDENFKLFLKSQEVILDVDLKLFNNLKPIHWAKNLLLW